jgi:lipopolysaccharide biosynthesis glycosyltransferase
MRIYIGWDHREEDAFRVAKSSAIRFGHEVVALREDRLRAAGLLTRPVDRRGNLYDLISAAPASTDFAISRFFAPILAHDGWALFTDCDVVFLRDPAEMMELVDDSKAVMVVKHPPMKLSGLKMDGQQQLSYRRKLWSSVMLINASHPANARLNVMTVNQLPGRDLHAFCWLADGEIGELPREWNWLVGLTDKPENPGIAHFTLGTPNLPGLENSEHAKVWFDARRS